MIDEKGNIITKNDLLKKCYHYIKANTAQIVIIIPILAAIYAAVSNYYFFIVNCGYYNYFKIDKRLMLPYNKISLYQNVGQIALSGLYWAYAIFAVRIFLIKRNYIWKFMFLIIIPFFINIVIAHHGEFNASLIVICAIFLPFHWGMIFALGYCMVSPLHQDILNKPKKTKAKKIWNC